LILKLQRYWKIANRVGFDGFLLGIIVVIFLAYLWPTPGLSEGRFSLSAIANYGVSLIFFLYGLRLSPARLRTGLSNWHLHLVVQFSTFMIFPLVALFFKPWFSEGEFQVLWLGTFYLAALPSTVSSSVVMVSIAGGNLPSAIFNASVSSLIGVFITPLWMGLVLTATSRDYDIWLIIGKLTLQVLFPVMLGILLIPKLGNFAERHRQSLKYFDQSIILLIVYTAFCESFARRMFQSLNFLDLIILGFLMVLFFFLVYFLIHLLSRILKFNREDRVTALFCGSKKSLVQGTVMSKVLFADSPVLGIILLPIMIYHSLQLIIVSVLAQSMARRVKDEIEISK
jgi:sodium/bile acid cotransporter 7